MKMFFPVFLEVVFDTVLRVQGEDESWHRVLSAFFGPRRAFATKLMATQPKYSGHVRENLSGPNPIARKTQVGGWKVSDYP